MARSKMAPVYIGDVGEMHTFNTVKYSLPEGFDTSQLTLRELCNLALVVGLNFKDIIGVSSCDKHYGMVKLGSGKLPDGYNLLEHCSYCKQCWEMFRLKRID